MVYRYLNTIIYLAICLSIAIPFNYSNYRLLYTDDGIPAGADSAFHTYSILKILNTNNPLISYSAYPTILTNSSSYYPSFMHLTAASIAKIAAINQASISDPFLVIEAEKALMLGASLAGTIGYALFIRSMMNKLINDRIKGHSPPYRSYHIFYLSICVLAFGIFINSVSPIVKTYNDGTYGEIFAMWCVFPYYLYLLTRSHWIASPILLAIIAGTHNLGFLMSLSATIPYLVTLIFQRTKRLKRNLVKFVVIFTVFAAPSFVLFYFPATTSVLDDKAAEAVHRSWPRESVISQLMPGLYFAGTIATVVALILNYRILAWLSVWGLIYFVVFDLSSVLGPRFARELSITFGMLVGICISYVVFMCVLTTRKWLSHHILKWDCITIYPIKIIIAVSISAILISAAYIYFQDHLQKSSNPIIVKYFTETFDRSNRFFLNVMDGENNHTSADEKRVIALFGDNPWLKVTTFGKYEVLGVQPPNTGYIGKIGSSINDEIHQIITSPNMSSTSCIIKKYSIDYVYISDMLPGRWYHPVKSESYYKQLDNFQNINHSPYFKLETEFFGDGGHVRIYSTSNNIANGACAKYELDISSEFNTN